ncbi:bifunctional pyr operon transcriptional regulator/uracil phosphoribosyltransferase PyrR [Alkalilimnicola sp. S0819]|uniref:bifunctional pyr operon transcriptional regulator/uracil phosphoribosyltransferase PyrR n=1 Tax=Alkalilimnicola sp. S0819 TaxID=2613922 RepID=UPI001262758F|nr:bifunctional pyr operon transcriptional regulator/uracil phosphoribosyltransferase PyrR [Alkalilimnicola sp. S0819]KAB7624462.1 bifunctional pyr operon transcriptional regulator/uracil phosphoribosyltransferase PyrR [Alkalilimnicola sp. S0819]MPQ16297.1 bifunctional pyr operon transcriptional regulator/uracil phosphoribosyltransferase PyrR [Alkalilimnicola sp. S0819]
MEQAEKLIERMAEGLAQLIEARGLKDPAMIGIHTGGAWIAERLHPRLGLRTPLGTLGISFYRDDFSRIGMHPRVQPSQLPFEVEGRHILLIDDVLYTGRTIRAALNEIFDYGRPAGVHLAVAVDRGGRELPIAAEVVGQHLALPAERQIKLRGPEPLQWQERSL